MELRGFLLLPSFSSSFSFCLWNICEFGMTRGGPGRAPHRYMVTVPKWRRSNSLNNWALAATRLAPIRPIPSPLPTGPTPIHRGPRHRHVEGLLHTLVDGMRHKEAEIQALRDGGVSVTSS